MAGLSRRSFLRSGAAAGGGLLIAFSLPGCKSTQQVEGKNGAPSHWEPNAWLRINTAGVVTFILDKVEMGQGVHTGMTMVVADELGIAPEDIHIEFAPVAAVYGNASLGFQVTGGSTSTKDTWDVLHDAGSMARDTLRQEAAERWGVSVDTVVAEGGRVHHRPPPAPGLKPEEKSFGFGELAETAHQRRPAPPKPKAARAYSVIGTPVKRLDAKAKAEGTAAFGIDITLPNMVYAHLVRCPVRDGKAVKIDASAAKKLPGVVDVRIHPAGVLVAADSWWRAKEAGGKVVVEWDKGENAKWDSDALFAQYRKLSEEEAKVIHRDGAALETLDAAPMRRRLVATYEVPYLAHATMEPQNCIADVRDDGAQIICGNQAPTMVQQVVAAVCNLDIHKVEVVTTFMGGGFGRRGVVDFASEAAVASQMLGRPVKLVWSREDDQAIGWYRPMGVSRVAGSVDDEGRPAAWHHRLVGQSILSHIGPAWVRGAAPEFIPPRITDGTAHFLANLFRENYVTDQTSVEGTENIPYGIENQQVEFHNIETGVPIGFWRSVGHSGNAFVVESFLDELAHLGGKDPYALRLELLEGQKRHKNVLLAVGKASGWGKPLPAGRAHGVAIHKCFGSVCAQVAEVSVGDNGRPRVHKVTVALDCGQVVNPDVVEAQLEGGVVYALSALLDQSVTFKGGVVQEENFHNYPALRMNEMPEIDVVLVDTGEKPSGVGELAVPPLAPAVCNAIFKLTGKRIRRLPILDQLA